MRCMGGAAAGQAPWGTSSIATSMARTTAWLSTVRRMAMPWIGSPARQTRSPLTVKSPVFVSRSSASMSHRPSSRR